MQRRRAIVAAVGLAAGLAGCSTRQPSAGDVDLTVFNQSARPYTIEVGFFADGDSRAEARAYATTLDIAADGQETRADVVDAGRYQVRYSAYADDSRLTDEGHIHYIPPENGTAGVTFDIQETGTVTRR